MKSERGIFKIKPKQGNFQNEIKTDFQKKKNPNGGFSKGNPNGGFSKGNPNGGFLK